MILQAHTKDFTCTLLAAGGKITHAPELMRWMEGKDLITVIQELEKYEGFLEWISDVDEPNVQRPEVKLTDPEVPVWPPE